MTQRRTFVKDVISISALAMVPSLIKAEAILRTPAQVKDKGFTFLFQGDSITDGNRTRNNDWNHVMGHGYQYIIASKLWYDYPEKELHFFNRGISGNTVGDLSARWQTDTLDLKPDLLSILIGINDTSQFIGDNKKLTAEQYESEFKNLLDQTRQQLPDVQFVLCEPFILPVGRVKEKWDEYSAEVTKRQEVVKRLATEHDAIFVGFQSAFDKALSKAQAEYWIWDGIHPMPAGHELMAREWMREVGKKYKFVKY